MEFRWSTHCVIGTDRTGALAYLILALFDVSEEDIYRDYCFSNLGDIGVENTDQLCMPDRLQGKVGMVLKAVSGKTLQQKTRNYQKSIGIPEATLNAVARIMLE